LSSRSGNRWRIESPTAERPAELFFHLFRMETDLKAVQQELTRRDPRWAEWVDALSGLRLMRWLSAEECLFSFLCTPANNIPRITGMIERLCEQYGAPIHHDGDTVHHAFPTVERLAQADEATLRELGFGYRAKTLIAAACALTRARRRLAKWLANAGLLGRQSRN
jgi:N-glycosylase/DNA lyase